MTKRNEELADRLIRSGRSGDSHPSAANGERVALPPFEGFPGTGP
jgi:hypothetical protein